MIILKVTPYKNVKGLFSYEVIYCFSVSENGFAIFWSRNKPINN